MDGAGRRPDLVCPFEIDARGDAPEVPAPSGSGRRRFAPGPLTMGCSPSVQEQADAANRCRAPFGPLPETKGKR
jgi:hypothetical protein